MEVGECCRTDPGQSSDSGVLGSGTHSWVLGPHPDALGTCKSGSWGAIVGEELPLRGLGETPKQPSLVSVARSPGGGSVEVLRDPGDGTASEGVHFA